MDDNPRETSLRDEVAPSGTLLASDEADKLVDEFESLLDELGVRIAVRGELERLLLMVKWFDLWSRNRSLPLDGTDLQTALREVVGATQLVKLVVEVGSAALAPFKDHLALLNVGRPLQNVPAPPNDPSSDKTLELIVGLAAARMGAEVSIDHPERSKGDNPDVIARWDARTWGLACKSISGDAPATLFERVREGIEQIERSRAERGLVVLSFKNRLDHDRSLPILGVDEDGDAILGIRRSSHEVCEELRGFARERIFAMREFATQVEVDALFAGKKAIPIVLVVLQTTTGVRLPAGSVPRHLVGTPVPTRIGFVHGIGVAQSDPSESDCATRFMSALNDSLHV